MSAFLYLLAASWLLLITSCKLSDKEYDVASISSIKQPESGIFHTPDTADINALLSSANKIVFTQIDSAIARYQQALHWSKQMHYFSSAATAYRNLAFCYQQKGNYSLAQLYTTEAVAYLKQVMPTAQLLHQSSELRKIYVALIDCYIQMDAYPELIATCRDALPSYSLNDTVQKLQFLTISQKMASAFFVMGQYDSASNIYMNMLPLLKTPTKENYTIIGYTYLGLAGISSRISSPEKALAYFNQAIDLGKKFGDTSMQIDAIGNVGTFYLEQTDFEQAKKYAFNALSLSEHTNVHNVQISSQFHNNYIIAACLMQQDQPEAALKYSEITLRKAFQTNAESDKVMAFYLIGSNYAKLGQYKKAERYLRDGLRSAKKLNFSDQLSAGYGQLGIVYARMGRYKKAYDFKSAYITMRDSLRSKDNAAHIARMDARYRVSEKDKMLAQNKLQIANQQIKIKNQYLLVIIILSTAFFALLILVLVLRKRRHRTEVERLQARIAGEEQERTRMAMELHDGIVSRLSIIKTNLCTLPQSSQLPGEQDALQEAIAQLDQGIAELRTTSHNLLPEILQQAGLVGALEIYCRKITQTGTLDIDFQLIGRLPLLKEDFQLNCYRIIQEVVSNILKHAGATTALIQFTSREEKLAITIDDNGSRAYTGEINTGPGIGMHNLHSRLQLLRGRMETERNEGTSVYLTFDLKPFLIPSA